MTDLLRGPAYRVETERLVLRCFEPKDAAVLKAAIDASLDHLRPWVPWAEDEPQSLDLKVELLRDLRSRFDSGLDRVYGVFDPAESEVLGGCGLYARVGERARELGYWVAERHARQGYATEAAAALVRVGFEIDGLDRIEIHCEPENRKSVGLAEKLGFRHDGTLRARVPHRAGPPRDTWVASMLRAELAESPCARAPIAAFDAIGRRLSVAVEPAARRGRSAFR